MSYSAESEMAVIGGLLLDPAAFDRVCDLLTAESFWGVAHRLAYQAIAGMHLASQPVDVITVAEWLDRAGHLDAVGGLAYLSDMAMATPSAAGVRHHAKLVASRYVERQLESAAVEIREIVAGTGSTAEKLDRAQALVTGIAERSATDSVIGMRDALTDALTELDARMSNGGMAGISTGFPDLDKPLSGMKPGDLIVVAGRPAMGKTTLAMGIAQTVAVHSPVLVFSLEMPVSQLTTRMLASQSRVSLDTLMSSQVSEDDWNRVSSAVARMQGLKLSMVDASILSVLQLRAHARRHARKHGLGLIVIDYLQLMHHGNPQNPVEGLAEISRGLKLIAKELNVPVIALSQLSRDCEKRPDKRPVMSDLRSSGAIEQDADAVIMVYRDEVYDPDTSLKGTAELLIRKNRHGPLADVFTAFLGEYNRFESYAHGYAPERDKPKPKKRSDLF